MGEIPQSNQVNHEENQPQFAAGRWHHPHQRGNQNARGHATHNVFHRTHVRHVGGDGIQSHFDFRIEQMRIEQKSRRNRRTDQVLGKDDAPQTPDLPEFLPSKWAKQGHDGGDGVFSKQLHVPQNDDDEAHGIAHIGD